MGQIIRNGVSYGLDAKDILNSINDCIASTNETQVPSVEVIKEINTTVEELKTTVQTNTNNIYNAIVAQGTTPISKNNGDIVTSISTMSTNRYNAGVTAGKAAAKPTLIGSYTGNQNINVGSWASGRTAANFIIEITSVGSSSTAGSSNGDYNTGGAKMNGTTVSKSLSGTTLSVKGCSVNAQGCWGGSNRWEVRATAYGNISYKVWVY